MAQTQAYYGAYSLELSKALSSYQLDTNAKRAIDYIAQLPYNDQNKQVFNYFLQNWGTSVIIDEVQGGFLQYACIMQASVWNWGGIGHVSSEFIKGEAEGYYNDKTLGSNYTSAVFQDNSVCSFYCTGGNPEACPTNAAASPLQWASTIWGDPQSISYNVVPISEVIRDTQAKISIQQAIYSYYDGQVDQWQQYATSCSECLPTLSTFIVALKVPFDTPTTVKAGTCTTAIRVTAWGSCFFLMYNNDLPIGDGTYNCDYKNSALWGMAAYYGITNPVVEWIIPEVNVDNTLVAAECNYPESECNYWSGHYSVICM